MTLFRRKNIGQLYTIEHLIVDLHYADWVSRCGLYCYPYKHEGDELVFNSRNKELIDMFIKSNFEIVGELSYL